MLKDVPSPIDLRHLSDALEWQNSANIKRPWREDFFQFYTNYIKQHFPENANILELGSGPGFLAKLLLSHLPNIRYTAFDFSLAMHQLSQQKMSAKDLQRMKFIVGDFKQDRWQENLDQYDVIIIHQALHELRHKSYAIDFHNKIKSLMKINGVYFVCDHLYGDQAMQNDQLYMTKQEHIDALQIAGFENVKNGLEINGLCLFNAQ